MISFKVWPARRRDPRFKSRVYCSIIKEGWFLFGIIPLYVRDTARAWDTEPSNWRHPL